MTLKQPPPFEAGFGRPDLDMLYRVVQMIDLGERVEVIRHGIVTYLNDRPQEKGKPMWDYGYLNADRDDPRWYENQPHQHNTSTATVWALHLHVPASDPEDKVADVILNRMALLPETTGEFTHGDSWRQWGEPSEGDGDVHMVVYFKAEPDRAAAVGQHLATHATFAVRKQGYRDVMLAHTVSTSGDYAEVVF